MNSMRDPVYSSKSEAKKPSPPIENAGDAQPQDWTSTDMHDRSSKHGEASICFENFDILLLDIEGTVCPVSFVKDVLFPYALDALPAVLDQNWDAAEFAEYRNLFPEPYRSDRQALEEHVKRLIREDIKASYLKALQGYLWRRGYETGDLSAPLFDDVEPFLKAAQGAGKRVIIYSSGSVPAQKLLMGHTNAPESNLTHLISDWYDTTNAGPKTDAASYSRIMSNYSTVDAGRWLFLSDNLLEVEAALAAGMHSVPVVRPGNSPLPSDNTLSARAICNFKHEPAEGH